MSASKRYPPYWFSVFVVLFATLAGLHPEAFANGTNAVGNQGRTQRPGDGNGGCTAASGCHFNQTATVNIDKVASFVLPGGSTVITVTAFDTTNTAGLHLGMDLATKKDTAGTNATLTESAGNLLALPSGTKSGVGAMFVVSA